MEYCLTEHARESLSERQIRLEWLELAIYHPQQIEADRVDAELEHRLVRIDEFDGRVLRVILNTSKIPPRIVTAFFDRGMRHRL